MIAAHFRRFSLLLAAALLSLAGGAAVAESNAPAPTRTYAFSLRAELLPPVEQGLIDGARHRFIAITGGTVSGPKLTGTVMAGGGDWQAIHPGGLTVVWARYFLKAADGTVIGVTNPGVRTASPDVIEKLTRGEPVDPSLYYFRTTPTFSVTDGPHGWMRNKVFVARGIRRPDHVMIDYYIVE